MIEKLITDINSMIDDYELKFSREYQWPDMSILENKVLELCKLLQADSDFKKEDYSTPLNTILQKIELLAIKLKKSQEEIKDEISRLKNTKTKGYLAYNQVKDSDIS